MDGFKSSMDGLMWFLKYHTFGVIPAESLQIDEQNVLCANNVMILKMANQFIANRS